MDIYFGEIEELIVKYYIDKNIENTERVFPIQGRYGYYRYDMNENPEGLPKDFVNSVVREITPEFLSTYPEPNRFINKYSHFVGAKFENILTTNGSDMAIRYLMQVFGEKGKEVISVFPSFEMYRVNCSILGLKNVMISYNADMKINVDKILEAITSNTCIVVLINPNNPIGDTYTEEEIKRVIAKAKEFEAIVIIDEAYHYFYPDTSIQYALNKENVIVLRTFSKLFSIAACRLGIIISNVKIINYVRKVRLTFDANAIALLFGERILEQPQLVENLIKIQKEGKQYLIEELQRKGYECKEGRGNFIFVKPYNNAQVIAERLKIEKRVLVHAYSNELLRDYLRITTGSKASMKIFVDALLIVDKRAEER